jgi:hypothetical protein
MNKLLTAHFLPSTINLLFQKIFDIIYIESEE